MTVEDQNEDKTPAVREMEMETERQCRRSMRRLRFETGLAVLVAAMGAMVILVLLDVFFSMRAAAKNSLIENAFEAFKLIAVTVLGYIFGANQTKSGPEE